MWVCTIMVNLNLIQQIGNLLAWTKYNHFYDINPDSKVHGVNMGPIWGWQDPGGHHVGPMNIAIWETHLFILFTKGLWCTALMFPYL